MTLQTDKLRILITDTHELAGLGAVRSLGRAGHHAVAAYPERWPAPPATYSRWCGAAVAAPDAWTRQWAFREWLTEQLASGDYDAILPLSEAAVVATAALRPSLGDGIIAMAPDDKDLKYTLSKFHSNLAAREAGLSIPATVFISDGSPDSPYCDELEALRLPVIFKIDNYLSSDGVYVKGATRVARDIAEAKAILDELRGVDAGAIAQEFVQGHGRGAFLLRWQGRTHLRFAHRRIHEVPWSGGYSSLRASVHDPSMLIKAEHLLDTLDYSGVAMVEYRVTPAGVYHFMEINGRLWGSLALALHAGVDFPAALVDCYVHGKPLPRHVAADYPDGLQCRNTLPGELYHLVSVLKARPGPGSTPPGKLSSLLNFGVKTFDPRVRRDFFWSNDIRPWLVQARHVLGEIAGRVWNKLAARWHGRQRRRLLSELKERHANHAARDTYFAQRPRNLLFLCYGNICRSSFAEFYWLAHHRDNRLADIEVVSAGFFEQVGRSSPARFDGIVRELGVNMTTHRSKMVTRKMIDEADAVFAMDLENARDIERSFPDALDKTHLLGLLADEEDGEIVDPYILPPGESRSSYRKLARALDALAVRLRASSD